MNHEEILAFAAKCGFDAALLPTKDVPFNAEFRKSCEENLCGQYGVHYACPPACGTPAELQQRIQEYETALVMKSEWPIESYEDHEAIRIGKAHHNAEALRLLDAMRSAGHPANYAGASCCDLCEVCAGHTGQPCAHPERRFSCLSAYCVDVAETAKRCGMSFSWDTHKLTCYSIIAFR